jgi:hypothetical protein
MNNAQLLARLANIESLIGLAYIDCKSNDAREALRLASGQLADVVTEVEHRNDPANWVTTRQAG